MLTPTVRRTLAPRGPTPILKFLDRHDRISAISAVTISPRRRDLGLYFRLLHDDANDHAEDIVSFLVQLREHIRGPMTILWDGAKIHGRSRLVRAYLAKYPEIHAEPLPAYAPETNPDENVWRHTKHARLANIAADDLRELRRTLIEELDRLHGRPDLLAAFVEHARIPVMLQNHPVNYAGASSEAERAIRGLT
jgi:transposase